MDLKALFFNWSCSTKAPVPLYQYEYWAIFEWIICTSCIKTTANGFESFCEIDIVQECSGQTVWMAFVQTEWFIFYNTDIVQGCEGEIV